MVVSFVPFYVINSHGRLETEISILGQDCPTLGLRILTVLHVLSDLQLPWITCCPI